MISMLALAALAPLAHPQTQDPVVLFAEGDPHPGGGTIPVSFTGFIGRHGSWAARIPVTSSGERPGLIRDGVAVLLDGDPIPGGNGATARRVLNVDHHDVGLTAYGVEAESGGGHFFVLEDRALAREGDPVPAAYGLTGSRVWRDFFGPHFKDEDEVALLAEVSGLGSVVNEFVGLVLEFDDQYQVTNSRLVTHRGALLSDGRSVTQVNSSLRSYRINRAGQVMWCGVTNNNREVTAIDRDIIAERYEPTPEPGLTWSVSQYNALDINDSGDWVINGFAHELPPNVVMRRDGLVARTGMSHPAFPSYTARLFGTGLPNEVYISNDGVVAFYVVLNDANGVISHDAVVVGDRAVLESGVTRVGAETVVGLGWFEYTKDGRDLVAEATLLGPSGQRRAMLHVRFGPGRSYCVSEVNSTGERACIRADGTAIVSQNDLTVTADDLPPFSFGYFNVSETAGFSANPGGSQGNLCLGGSIGRYRQQAMNSGVAGRIHLAIDLTSVPSPVGPFAATPGTTLHFQAWFRDANPMPTSNFTNGVAVTLE